MSSSQMSPVDATGQAVADDVTRGTDAVAAVVEPKEDSDVGRAMAEACEAARMEAAATVEASAARAHDPLLTCEFDCGPPVPRFEMSKNREAPRAFATFAALAWLP